MPTARRRIDANLRDYVLTLGSYEPDVGITSKVHRRIATKRGSIKVLPRYGSLLHTIKGPFAGFEKLAERHVHDALADMVGAREVNRLKVTVRRGGSAVNAALDLDLEFYDRRGRRLTVAYTHRVQGV